MPSKIATKPKTFGPIQSYTYFVTTLLKERLDLKGKRAFNQQYGIVSEESGKVYIDYKLYKKILSLYFMKAGARLINGYTVDLLNTLGCLFILRIGRNPENLRLNRTDSFKKLKQLKATGRTDIRQEEWKSYYTDDEYIRLKWFKPSFVRNIKFYTFSPANGQPGKGFKQLMSRTISSNPRLLALYPFVPYKN